MVTHCLLRRTTVIDDTVVLPRPKITQDLVMTGSKEACMEEIEKLSLKPENQSTDIIEVELTCVKWTGQKTQTSQSYRKNNGSRDTCR